MTIINIKKTIPENSIFGGYSSGGLISIDLLGMDEFILNSKKDLMKQTSKSSPSKWVLNQSDTFNTKVLDLKSGSDDLVIKGYLEDDDNATAWEKMWQLRAMCVTGGPLVSLIIDNITFSSSTETIYLEGITCTKKADDTQNMNITEGDGISRIDVSLNLFVATAR